MRIWSAGDQLSTHFVSILLTNLLFLSSHILFRTSRQIRPSLSTFGWKILVRKRILGGAIG